MGKFIKTGRVVLLLHGRFAGKKAVVVQNSDNGTKERKYGHALVAGIDKAPMKIHKGMGKKRRAFRSRVRPFIKVANYNHLMPTRYHMDLPQDVQGKISASEQSKKEASKKLVRTVFQDRYKAGKNKWFFQKLRF
ncbi:60S ribosomal protein L27-B [Diplonema papillatum]|nr:60S ribosomal protein L27-B [Diplonema papillatum]KAJ9468046.1 60S ribosomal protein L27-B [Diplonema papillatum]|eukprot:gene13952-21338_t